jgi:hypothetical protein
MKTLPFGQPDNSSRLRRQKIFDLLRLPKSAAGLTIAGVIIYGASCRSADVDPVNSEIPVPQTVTSQTPVKTPAAMAEKTPVVYPEPRRAAAFNKAVVSFLNSWKASIESRNLDKHLRHYDEELTFFYTQQNVTKDFVRAEREQAFAKFETLKLELENIDVVPYSKTEATAVFDKTWDFKGARLHSTGSVKQEVELRKIKRDWFIVAEKDLQVYSSRNQELPLSSNASQ